MVPGKDEGTTNRAVPTRLPIFRPILPTRTAATAPPLTTDCSARLSYLAKGHRPSSPI